MIINIPARTTNENKKTRKLIISLIQRYGLYFDKLNAGKFARHWNYFNLSESSVLMDCQSQ